MSDAAKRGGGAAALAARCGAAAVVGGGRRPRRRRLPRGDRARRQAAGAAASRAQHRPPGVRILRGRPARLERALARGGGARARLSPRPFVCREFDGGVGGRARRQGRRCRPSISTTRPLRCSPLRSGQRAFGEDVRLAPAGDRVCARALAQSLRASRRRLSARIATGACRSDPTRICTCSKRRWPGSRSTAIRPGGRWRTASPSFASSASSIRRAERCGSSSPPTGRRRRASRAASPSPAITTNGRSCSIAGQGSPAGERPAAAARLIAFADAHGIDARRGVAINAVLIDGSVHDPVARLWAQAERMRAYWWTAAPTTRRGSPPRCAVCGDFSPRRPTASGSISLAADDRFVVEPARATSLYHVVGAVAALATVFPTDSRPTLT